MPNDIAPATAPRARATAATMAPNLAPPGLAVAAPPHAEAPSAAPAPAPAPPEGAPRPRQRRGPRVAATAPAAPPAQPVSAGVAVPLTDDELQDLGALQVLSARAGVSVEEYTDDARRLLRSYERFQAYVAARKAVG